MKAFFRPWVLAALCLFLYAQTTAQQAALLLRGVLQNDSGVPVSGAEIEITGLHRTVISDSVGAFSFAQIPRGNHSLQVRAPGYRTRLITATVPQPTSLHITLQEAVVEAQEVVVTGISGSTEKRRTPLAIATIRQAELLQDASTNIVDALTHIPGVNQITTGPAVSKPVIRGLGFNRTVVITDGVRQEGQQWGDEHGLEADDYQVEKVEVLKGPASLTYGSDALAGVINIIFGNPIPQGQIRGQFLANYQSNSNLRALHGKLGGNSGGLSWNGWGTGKEAQDYQNKHDGQVFNSRFRNLNFGGMLGIAGMKGSSRLTFSQFGQQLGLVEGERDSATGRFVHVVDNNGTAEETVVWGKEHSYKPVVPMQHIRHRKLIWANQLYLHNGSRLALTLGAQENDRREYEDILAPEVPALHLQLRTGTYDLQYLFKEQAGWNLTLGAGGMTQQNRNLGEEFIIPDYHLQEGGLYGLARRQNGRWLWSGGLRSDVRTLHAEGLTDDGEERFTDFNRTFANLSGSLGASYTSSESLTLRANAASGYRAPNIAELAANGVHEGTFRYEYGNRDLSPEHSFQLDLGATFSNEHVLVDGALFYNQVDNYIYLHKLFGASGTDSIPTAANPEGYSAYQFGQRGAALLGGELFVDLHPHPFHWLHFQNTFSYVAGHFRDAPADSMRYLPQIPPFRWTSELRADRPEMGRFLRNGYLKIGLDFTATQSRIFSAYETETETPGYWLLSAGTGVSVVNKKGRPLCDLLIAGQNLTDAAWQSHLSRLKYAPINEATGRRGIWGMGRNISVTLSVPVATGKGR